MPQEVLERFRFPTLAAALRLLHRPPPSTSLADLYDRRHPALHRLVFEELVAHQLGLRRLRYRQQRIQAPVLGGDRHLRAKLLAGLPFELTAAQRRVTEEIARDLERPYPMLRLLQGDVGSGKTVVAALACLQAVESGRQVALRRLPSSCPNSIAQSARLAGTPGAGSLVAEPVATRGGSGWNWWRASRGREPR